MNRPIETVSEWDHRLRTQAFEKGQDAVFSWEFEHDDGEDGCLPAGWYAIGYGANGAPITFPIRHEYGPFGSEEEAKTFTERFTHQEPQCKL